jgi:hypothetical protein
VRWQMPFSERWFRRMYARQKSVRGQCRGHLGALGIFTLGCVQLGREGELTSLLGVVWLLFTGYVFVCGMSWLAWWLVVCGRARRIRALRAGR